MNDGPNARDAYTQFIFDRLTAQDRRAPYASLIDTWYEHTKLTGASNSIATRLASPKRVEAKHLDNSSFERASLAALHCCRRRPQMMIEARWVVPLSALERALFAQEFCELSKLQAFLQRFARRIALTRSEATEYDLLEKRLRWELALSGAETQWLDLLSIPSLDLSPTAWAVRACNGVRDA